LPSADRTGGTPQADFFYSGGNAKSGGKKQNRADSERDGQDKKNRSQGKHETGWGCSLQGNRNIKKEKRCPGVPGEGGDLPIARKKMKRKTNSFLRR